MGDLHFLFVVYCLVVVVKTWASTNQYLNFFFAFSYLNVDVNENIEMR